MLATFQLLQIVTDLNLVSIPSLWLRFLKKYTLSRRLILRGSIRLHSLLLDLLSANDVFDSLFFLASFLAFLWVLKLRVAPLNELDFLHEVFEILTLLLVVLRIEDELGHLTHFFDGFEHPVVDEGVAYEDDDEWGQELGTHHRHPVPEIHGCVDVLFDRVQEEAQILVHLELIYENHI